MRARKVAGAALCVWLLSLPSGRAENAPEPALVRIVLAGDVMFGRLVDGRHRPYDAPIADGLRTRLQSADLTIVNLETGLCSAVEARAHAHETRRQRHRLVAPEARVDLLASLGVDLAVVANNHALDCGKRGLSGTLRALARRHIAAVGAHPAGSHELAYTRARAGGVEVITVAATEHLAPVPNAPLTPFTVARAELTLAETLSQLRAAHPAALIVLSLHWGSELAPRPSARQRVAAQRLIESGVDLVYGHGAHVLQDVERHGAGAIVYSAGNLHFDMATPSSLVQVSYQATRARPVLTDVETLSVPRAPYVRSREQEGKQ